MRQIRIKKLIPKSLLKNDYSYQGEFLPGFLKMATDWLDHGEGFIDKAAKFEREG